MAHCVNINLREFNDLVSQSGLDALQLSAKMGVWMEQNNSTEWPTLEQLGLNQTGLLREKTKQEALPSDRLAKAQKDYPGEITNHNNPYIWDLEKRYKLIEGWKTEGERHTKQPQPYIYSYAQKLVDRIKSENTGVTGTVIKTSGPVKNKEYGYVKLFFPLDQYERLDVLFGAFDEALIDNTTQQSNGLESSVNGLKMDSTGQLSLFRERKKRPSLKDILEDEVLKEQNKDQATQSYLRYLEEEKLPTPAEALYINILKALQFRLDVLKKAERNSLDVKAQEGLIGSLMQSVDNTERIVNIVKRADIEITRLFKEAQELSKNTDKLTPAKLYRLRELASVFDALDDYKNYMSINPEEAKKYNTELQTRLRTIVDLKNSVKSLYDSVGLTLTAKFLTPYYRRVYAEVAIEQAKEYENKSEEYKSKITKEQHIENHKIATADDLEKQTTNLLLKELQTASKDVHYMYRLMDNMLDTRDPVAAAIVKAFVTAHDSSRMQTIVKSEEMLDVVEELETFSKNGIFTDMADFYSFALERNKDNKNTGYLIDKYTSEMWDDYKSFTQDLQSEFNPYEVDFLKTIWKNGLERLSSKTRLMFLSLEKGSAMDDPRGDFILPNKAERIKLIKKYLDNGQLAEKGNAPLDRDAFEKGLNNLYATLLTTTDEDGNKLMTEDEYSIIQNNSKKRYDEQFTLSDMVGQGWIRNETATRIFEWMNENTWKTYRQPKEKYHNPQWEQLITLANGGKSVKHLTEEEKNSILKQSTDPRIKMYNAIVRLGNEADKMLPYDSRLKGRLPGIVKSNSEKILAGDLRNPLDFFHRNMLQDFTLRPEDVERGSQILVDQHQQAKQFLPTYYTNKLDVKEQSFDLPTIYMKYWSMANDHSIKANILPDLEMARYFVNKRATVKKKVKGKDGKDIVELKDGRSNIAQQLNDWYTMVIYDKRKADGATFNLFGTEFSVEKKLDKINNFTSINLIGLNFISAVANPILGETLQAIETFAGQHINMKSYNKANLYYTKNLPGMTGDIGSRRPKNVATMLIRNFDILNQWDGITYRRNNKFSELMHSSPAFMLTNAGEHFMQSRFFFAMLEEKRAINEQGEDIGSILENYVSIDGKLQLKSEVSLSKSKWTEKDQEDFKIQVKGLLSRMHGEYGELGMVAIQRYALGRMAYSMRKFIIPGFKRRYEGYDYSERLGDFTEGSYVSTYHFIKGLIKDSKSLGFQVMSINWKKLSPIEKANIIRTMSEVSFFITAVILTNLLIRIKGEDDDPEGDKFQAFLLYQLFRYRSEMLFYISPGAAMDILRSPMASMSVFQNTIEVLNQLMSPFELYERGPNKGKAKLWKEINDMIPISRQFYRYQNLDTSINWFMN